MSDSDRKRSRSSVKDFNLQKDTIVVREERLKETAFQLWHPLSTQNSASEVGVDGDSNRVIEPPTAPAGEAAEMTSHNVCEWIVCGRSVHSLLDTLHLLQQCCPMPFVPFKVSSDGTLTAICTYQSDATLVMEMRVEKDFFSFFSWNGTGGEKFTFSFMTDREYDLVIGNLFRIVGEFDTEAPLYALRWSWHYDSEQSSGLRLCIEVLREGDKTICGRFSYSLRCGANEETKVYDLDSVLFSHYFSVDSSRLSKAWIDIKRFKAHYNGQVCFRFQLPEQVQDEKQNGSVRLHKLWLQSSLKEMNLIVSPLHDNDIIVADYCRSGTDWGIVEINSNDEYARSQEVVHDDSDIRVITAGFCFDALFSDVRSSLDTHVVMKFGDSNVSLDRFFTNIKDISLKTYAQTIKND